MSKNDSQGMYSDRNTVDNMLDSIPLVDLDAANEPASIASLVKDATTQMSSLIRSEVELAKTEVAASAKKAGLATGLFGAALIVLAYSSFFLFFFLAELLDVFVSRWLAFLIVFLGMITVVAALALVGLKQIKGVRKPEKTIESVNQLKSVLPSGGKGAASSSEGMFS